MKLLRLPIIVLYIFTTSVSCVPSAKLDSPATCGVDACEGMSPWRDFGKLTVSFAKAGAKPAYLFNYYSMNGETHTTLAQPSADPYSKMHIIPGVAIVYFGRLASGDCAENYDIPAVLAGYETEIIFYLSRAAPAGPEAIQTPYKFFAREKNAPTRVQIDPGNYISFKSPWKIEGELTREDADTVGFRIHETLSGEIKEERQLDGYWSKDVPDSLVTNETSLDGWLICPIGNTKNAQNFQTFGDLRSAVAK